MNYYYHMPSYWKECLHFQEVTPVWKTQSHLLACNNIKIKEKHTQLFWSPPFSQVIHFSKCFSPQHHLLSHHKPCEPWERWFTALRQCQPHDGFHINLLSLDTNKSSKVQLAGSFPSKKGPWWKKLNHSKPKYWMEDFFHSFFFSGCHHKTWNKYLLLPSLICFWRLWSAEMTWNINFQMDFLLGYLASWEQWIRGLDVFADPCSLLSWTHIWLGRIRSIN